MYFYNQDMWMKQKQEEIKNYKAQGSVEFSYFSVKGL